MFRSIIPKDDRFFDKFDHIADLTVQAAEVLKAIIGGGDDVERLARKVKTLEHEADEAVHATMEHLHRTFVTPLDRSDIHRLAMQLDNILDLTDAAASRIALYQPKGVPEEAPKLALVLLDSAGVVREMVRLVRRMKEQADRILELSVEVNRLENEADQIRRSAMARLFREEGDVFEVIKWKEILEYIEGATDRCEDVSDILQGIVIENS